MLGDGKLLLSPFFNGMSTTGTVHLSCMCAKLLQLCPTLCNPMDRNLSGSSVQGILQSRILEWVAMASSRGSFQPRDQTCISYASCTVRKVLYHYRHLEAPHLSYYCILEAENLLLSSQVHGWRVILPQNGFYSKLHS